MVSTVFRFVPRFSSSGGVIGGDRVGAAVGGFLRAGALARCLVLAYWVVAVLAVCFVLAMLHD